MGWTYECLGWFHCRSAASLWRSGTITFEDAFDAQRQAGICLYQRGGRECMQFNDYVLHYVMCGEHFVADPPHSAFGFASQIEPTPRLEVWAPNMDPDARHHLKTSRKADWARY
ncbi:unnamed protein product [Symbiodinium sp. CCMP2592]|nr:unnamed protein product [Symbiodinium sp. CCMP2592]